MFHPSIDEFKTLAEQGNPVPVYRQLLADALTPVSAFQALADAWDVSLEAAGLGLVLLSYAAVALLWLGPVAIIALVIARRWGGSSGPAIERRG